MDNASHHDAIVIGAGPAGLAGALYLARFRRDVLVIDEGHSRAARIPRSHNVAGFPTGVNGARLVGDMRQHAEAHGVRFVAARVESLEREGDDGFMAHWTNGSARAPLVLLATGASDIEPDMPHLTAAMRVGALRYCPVCDGYEVIGQRVGVITNSAAGVNEALYISDFTPDVYLYVTDASVKLGDADQQRLADAGIGFSPDPVREIRLVGKDVEVDHGTRTDRLSAIYSTLGMKVHSDLAVRLGAEADEQGYLHTDSHQQTTVPGLYAAGDTSRGLNQISVAAGEAAIAASAMHLVLRKRAKASSGAAPASNPG